MDSKPPTILGIAAVSAGAVDAYVAVPAVAEFVLGVADGE